MACGLPNTALGTAQRYVEWFDCNARALGESGFLGLAGYVVDSGILTGLLTIFVALIGYRLLVGGRLNLGDGVGWAIKIGVIIALLGGWTAFQSIFYQLVIVAPEDIANRTLLASGVPTDETGIRFQRAYDALRLGLPGNIETVEGISTVRVQPALPATAITFLAVTVGAVGVAKLLAGFFLAIAPLPIALLLFGPGMGLFVGWLRVLIATILAAVGLMLTSRLCLLAIESEVSRMQALGTAGPGMMDEQAPAAVVATFLILAVAMLVLSLAMAQGLAERIWQWDGHPQRANADLQRIEGVSIQSPTFAFRSSQSGNALTQEGMVPRRSFQIASALQRHDTVAADGSRFRSSTSFDSGKEGDMDAYRSATGSRSVTSNRRALGRRHRSSAKRDRAK